MELSERRIYNADNESAEYMAPVDLAPHDTRQDFTFEMFKKHISRLIKTGLINTVINLINAVLTICALLF